MIRSDYQSWALLSAGQKTKLSEVEIYKACVIAANNGWTREEETGLGNYQRVLLESRRQIKSGRLEQAKKLLSSLRAQKPNSEIDPGDLEFLKGIVMHRLGDQYAAAGQLAIAANVFSKTGDSHRLLRALINEKISAAMNLQAYLLGDLYVLQNQAVQHGYHDLAGLVFCARAGELIVSGRFSEAVAEAHDAVMHYQIASCPEDLALAQMMLTIAQFMSGDSGGARLTFQRVHIRDGKIASYVAIFEALIAEKRPVPPLGHPLYGTQWKVQGFKKESVTGKILSCLKNAPATRDELILLIWGPNSTHPSYCNRLYSALNQIRKQGQHQVVFDGEKYTFVV